MFVKVFLSEYCESKKANIVSKKQVFGFYFLFRQKMKRMDFFRAHGTSNMKSIESIQQISSFSPGLHVLQGFHVPELLFRKVTKSASLFRCLISVITHINQSIWMRHQMVTPMGVLTYVEGMYNANFYTKFKKRVKSIITILLTPIGVFSKYFMRRVITLLFSLKNTKYY